MWTGNILANTNVLQPFEVQDCPPEEKKGKGVFAKKRIFKGEFVGVYDGDYIDKKESERRSLEYHMVWSMKFTYISGFILWTIAIQRQRCWRFHIAEECEVTCGISNALLHVLCSISDWTQNVVCSLFRSRFSLDFFDALSFYSIDPTRVECIAKYINHSRQRPNLKPEGFHVNDRTQILFFATKVRTCYTPYSIRIDQFTILLVVCGSHFIHACFI